MRTTGIIIFLFIFSFTLHAQYSNNNSDAFGSIRGSIIDSLSSKPLEYASLSLYRSKDSAIVHGTVTNENGLFALEKVPFGRYFIKISFIGYQTLKIPNLLVVPKKPILDLGVIKVRNSEKNLAEVVITGEKQMEEYSLDKKVINVEKNITSAGGTAVDVLRNIPSVTVDADDAISLRGQTDVKILVDGRPSTLTAANLEQIPASSIESIEVITNPSAKYSPEGMAGIINIKMKQRKDAGFNAVATVGAATGDKYNTSLNFNYNLKKVNFFGSYDYRLDNRPAYRNATTKTTPQNDTSTYLLQNSNSTRKVNTNNFKIGMDLFINKKNTITFSWMLKNSFKTSTENFQNIDSVYAYSDNNIISKYRKYFISNNIELNNDNDNDFAVNYKKTFDKKGKEFTADMIYTTDQSFFKQYITTDTSTIFPQTFTQTIMNTSIANMLVNFVNPLSKPDSKYEVGFQGTITNTDDENTYNLTALNYDFNQLNHFIYNLQTYDVYGLYSNTFQRFKYEAGLRLEQTFTSGVEKITGYEFNRQYFDYFPSLNITRKLWNSIDFRLSYTKRISRPNVNFLNPFVDRSNSPMYSSGNPNLNPQYVNSYELGGMKKWKKTTLNADVFYRQIDNVIKRIVTLDSIRNGYSYTDVTFQNLSSGISYGIDVILEQQILKFWKVNANYSYFKTIINGSNIEQGMTTNNYSYTAKLTSNMMLPQKFSFQITGFYNGPMVTPQGTMRPMSSVDAALKKDIWKDKASLSFRVSDIFNTLKFSTTVLGDGFTGTLVRKRETRIAFLSFTYKINGGVKQKAKPQQQDDKINLDDNL